MHEPYVASLARQLRATLERARMPSNLRQHSPSEVSDVRDEFLGYRLPWILRPVPRFLQALITAIFRVEL